MIDLAHLRANPDVYQRACDVKNIALDIGQFLRLDDERRELLTLVETMRAERNNVSKNIPRMKDSEKAQAIADMTALRDRLEKEEAALVTLEQQWQAQLLRLPSLPDARVPVGKDDSENVELRQEGKVPTVSFDSQDHIALGQALDIIDVPRGVKVAGSRSYFLKGDGARLELAVMLFTLDFLRGRGYTQFHPPVLANYDAMMGTSYFPGGEEQAYALGVQKVRGETIEADGLYLVGTSEVSVASYHSEETLTLADLPKRYCGYSTCFRREAGTYGKDTKGLYRVHQFQKVEQVILCEADEEISRQLHAELLGNAEAVLKALELPYRIVAVCTGDMGQGQVYKNDIETWMPSRGRYGETHSCSTFHDFQARRLNIKYIDAQGERRFVHTLNNTCIASPRILIPLLEMYQNADGSVTVPEVLRPYMGGQTLLQKT